MEARNMTGVLIQILMTRTLDPWLQRDDRLRTEVAQAKTQTQAEQNLHVRLWAENHQLQ